MDKSFQAFAARVQASLKAFVLQQVRSHLPVLHEGHLHMQHVILGLDGMPKLLTHIGS